MKWSSTLEYNRNHSNLWRRAMATFRMRRISPLIRLVVFRIIHLKQISDHSVSGVMVQCLYTLDQYQYRSTTETISKMCLPKKVSKRFRSIMIRIVTLPLTTTPQICYSQQEFLWNVQIEKLHLRSTTQKSMPEAKQSDFIWISPLHLLSYMAASTER